MTPREIRNEIQRFLMRSITVRELYPSLIQGWECVDHQPGHVRHLVYGTKLHLWEWQNGNFAMNELLEKVAKVAADYDRAEGHGRTGSGSGRGGDD